MARALIVIVAFLGIAVSAALAAPPADKGKPEKAKVEKTKPAKSESATSQAAGDDKNAAKKCKAERAAGEDAFKAKYGTNPNKANAFGKCVSGMSKAKKDKAKEDKDEAETQAEEAAEENAAKKCKSERATNPEAFKNKYGTNANKANAFGKCVSKLAKAQNS